MALIIAHLPKSVHATWTTYLKRITIHLEENKQEKREREMSAPYYLNSKPLWVSLSIFAGMGALSGNDENKHKLVFVEGIELASCYSNCYVYINSFSLCCKLAIARYNNDSHVSDEETETQTGHLTRPPAR